MGKFAASIERPKTKSASASGGLRPRYPLTRGSAPGPRWGLCPQTPVIGSRYRARHRAVSPQILRARTATGYCDMHNELCFVFAPSVFFAVHKLTLHYMYLGSARCPCIRKMHSLCRNLSSAICNPFNNILLRSSSSFICHNYNLV